MYTKITYVCDGAIYCGFKPEGVNVKEERTVLYPEKGYKLKGKDDKLINSVWLKDGDVQENYVEVEEKKDESSID